MASRAPTEAAESINQCVDFSRATAFDTGVAPDEEGRTRIMLLPSETVSVLLGATSEHSCCGSAALQHGSAVGAETEMDVEHVKACAAI